MSSSYRHTALQIGPEDATVTALLCALNARLWGQSHLLPHSHSAHYWRRQLKGERPMSLPTFVSFLRIVRWIGERVAGAGNGERWVAQILNVIAGEFGLEVVPKGQRVETAKPPKEELSEFAEASARYHVAVADALRDGICTDEERFEIAKLREEVEREADETYTAVVR